MRAKTYVTECQIAWAKRKGIDLMVSPSNAAQVGEWNGREDRTAYTRTLALNLFESISPEARLDFQGGDGGELEGNMQALYSSSALACNLFHHLRDPARQQPLLNALSFRKQSIQSLKFEQKRPVTSNAKGQGFSRDPNLDVVIKLESGTVGEVGIECKLREPWSSKPSGLRPVYLETRTLWTDLPNTSAYAAKVGTDDKDGINLHLHAAQLIKHLLGLKHQASLAHQGSFQLLYLFFDVPGEEGAAHHRELKQFAEAVAADGLQFRWMTCQEFILGLLSSRPQMAAFVDYLCDRYL